MTRAPRTASANARRSRRKGAEGEREIAALLQAAWPAAQRTVGQARSSKREGCDIERTPFWVECKRGARPDVLAAMRQARAETDGRPVLVVVRRDAEAPFVALSLADFLTLATSAVPR